jgi:hypothetical protein
MTLVAVNVTDGFTGAGTLGRGVDVATRGFLVTVGFGPVVAVATIVAVVDVAIVGVLVPVATAVGIVVVTAVGTVVCTIVGTVVCTIVGTVVCTIVGTVVCTIVGTVVGVVGAGAEAQLGPVMVSLISVTSPPIARARPSRVTLSPKWTPVPAMIVPAKELPLIVARLSTLQYRSQALAPLMKLIEPEDTKSLDALKI